MNDFNALFPNFTARCADLMTILMPVAFLFLVTGMIASMVTGRRSVSAMMRTFGRTIVYLVILTQLVSWGNLVCQVTDVTVRDVLGADPTRVYEQYNQALETRKSQTPQAGWWDKLFNVGTSVFEALISALLWIFGLLASVIVFYAYLIQKFILYLGYALAPIFIGFLAVRSLNQIGANYLLSLAGVMIWPLGWGAASLVTEGLLDFMTDQSFLWNASLPGAGGYAFQNFIGVAVLGVWLIFSTIAAPVIIQRAIAHGAQVGGSLISGAATAGATAAAGAAVAAGTYGSHGGPAGVAMAAAGGLAAGGTTLVGSSISGSTYSPIGSLITSLGQMSGARAGAGHGRSTNKESDATSAAIDTSGDNAVQALLRKTKNPHT